MATPTLDEIEALARAHADTAMTHDGYVRLGVLRVGDALLGLVAHVRALEKTTQLTDQAALDRITVMAERIAALEAPDDAGVYAGQLRRLLLSANGENHRLRALSEMLVEHQNALLAENAELRKRVEAGTWPAPQPIETAPLRRILTWSPETGQWQIDCPDYNDTTERWRTLRAAAITGGSAAVGRMFIGSPGFVIMPS